MKHLNVQLSADHLERLSRCRFDKALEELIWNGLDAGGPSVIVRFEINDLGVVSAIEVEDAGSGIQPSGLDKTFGVVGQSMKLHAKNTDEGRSLHGSEGRGRFKALVLGERARWTSVYRDGGELFEISITITRGDMSQFSVTEPKPVKGRQTGTTVRIDNIFTGVSVLLDSDTRQELAQRFALYLRNYPNVRVDYDGSSLDPSPLILRTDHYEIERQDVKESSTSLDVIEWRFKQSSKKLYICDLQGFAWYETNAGVHAKNIEYSAYLMCGEAKAWHDDNQYSIAELNPAITSVLELAKSKLREHTRRRLADEAQDLVKIWKQEKIYPYPEDDPSDTIKTAERQVFDIVASRVYQHHAQFRAADTQSKQFTLHLVRQALESNPTSLRRILQDVLKLPREHQDELAALLENVDLKAIIAAAKAVEQRLTAIEGFKHILFDTDWRKSLLERTQLHRLLVHHLWIFGDEYTLDSDDEPLRTLLEKHLHLLGRDQLAPDADVALINGKQGIPDLMLSRNFKRDRGRAEHLVLELKRPSVKLGSVEITQIENYAFTVAEDERFSKDRVSWTFILLGNELDTFARRKAEGSGLPYGCIHRQDNIEIWIKQWNEVLHDAKLRYDFFRDKLQLEASSTEGLQYLQTHYADLLAGKGLTKKQERIMRESKALIDSPEHIGSEP